MNKEHIVADQVTLGMLLATMTGCAGSWATRGLLRRR